MLVRRNGCTCDPPAAPSEPGERAEICVRRVSSRSCRGQRRPPATWRLAARWPRRSRRSIAAAEPVWWWC